MCQKRSTVMCQAGFRVDPCMRDYIMELRKAGVETLGCCCGHGRHKKTVIIRTATGQTQDYISGAMVPRKKRFYFRDADGYFFVPETEAS